MNQDTKQNIIDLYQLWADDHVVNTEMIPPSGSYREYIRIIGEKQTVMGEIGRASCRERV